MATTSQLVSLINFNTAEWQILKRWLEEEREVEVKALINSKNHDDSQLRRGAISKIDKLLGAERDAKASH